jgi:ATP-dependent DNA helicase RecQ
LKEIIIYKFQVENRQFDAFIKLLLRSYPGIFTEYCIVSEEQLAKKVQSETELVVKYLIALAKLSIISYYKAKQNPLIVYTEERLPTESLLFFV